MSSLWIFWSVLLLLFGEETSYAFLGQHLVASYKGCNAAALTDITMLKQIFEEAVKASGATILSSLSHTFASDGLTMVFLLSESHASIHTYPEHNACFIDLFTCGKKCDAARLNRFAFYCG